MKGTSHLTPAVSSALPAALVAAVLLGLLSPSLHAHAQCETDDDCKGDRICEAGVCVEAGECREDRDCGGGEVCVEGSCERVHPDKVYLLRSDPDASYALGRVKVARTRIALGMVLGFSGLGLGYGSWGVRLGTPVGSEADAIPGVYAFSIAGVALVAAGIPIASTGGPAARQAMGRLGLSPPGAGTRVVAWIFYGSALLAGGIGLAASARVISLGYVAEGVQQATMVGPVAGVLGATALILFSMDVRRCRKWIDSEYEFVDAPRSAESPGRDLLVAPVFAVTPEGGTLGIVGLW
jgi:hypothetical protein